MATAISWESFQNLRQFYFDLNLNLHIVTYYHIGTVYGVLIAKFQIGFEFGEEQLSSPQKS